MSHLLDPILSLPPAVAYVVIALLVFGEAAVFLGFVLPGETAVVLGGVLASRHDLSLPWLLVLVVVAAVVGDSVGYEVGKHYGDRVLRWRLLHKHGRRLDGARGYLRAKGGSAVFLGRWTAFFRAVMPGLAGMSRMPYRRFLVFNALGGVAWGTTFTLVGYLAGNSYAVVEKTVGRAGALVTLVVVLGALLLWHRRRRRSGAHGADGAHDGAGDDARDGAQDGAQDGARGDARDGARGAAAGLLPGVQLATNADDPRAGGTSA